MELAIPKSHRVAFLTFIRLPAPAMRELIKSLKIAIPKASLETFSIQLVNEKKGLFADDVIPIVRFLSSMYRYRAETEIPDKEFLDAFVEAGKREAKGILDADKVDWVALKKNVSEILKTELPLALTAKASELSVEHQRRLCPINCRILSDARPIFVGDPKKDPSAVLIRHELKIAFHEEDSGDVKEFYVALDGDDLLYLQTILWRAEEKDKSIRRLMKKTGIPVLGEEE